MDIRRDLSREAHLWYTITSPEYMMKARDRLQDAFDFLLVQLGHVPEAAEYPPLTYWGDRMKALLDEFDHGLALLRQGDFQAMIGWGGQLGSIPRGFDEGVRWMPAFDEFMKKLDRANSVAGHFWSAVEMSQMYRDDGYKDGTSDWHYEIPEDMGIVSNNILRNWEARVYEVIGRPTHIPEYAADTSVTCKTGDIVPWTGVWVPSTGMGTAALAFARQGIQIMQPAYELAREFAEDEYLEATKVVDTTWHPVKPTGRMIPLPPATGAEGADLAASAGNESGRCEAHHPCPREGFWFTPAKAGSRRFFKQGELMPEVKSDYGLTIWQWDHDQSA